MQTNQLYIPSFIRNRASRTGLILRLKVGQAWQCVEGITLPKVLTAPFTAVKVVKTRPVVPRRLQQPAPLAALLLALLALPLLAGCNNDGRREQAALVTEPQAASLPATTYFPLTLGDKTINVQLALTDAERARGLMGRKSLEPDHGMLFVFEQPSPQSFWMANTPLPLDIGYFDGDGVLREIYPLYPFDRSSVSSRRGDIRYALEMAQGWFAENAVRPGAKLDLEALAAALRQRGF